MNPKQWLFALVFSATGLATFAQSAKESTAEIDSLRDIYIDKDEFAKAYAYAQESVKRHKANQDENYLKALLVAARAKVNLGEYRQASILFEEAHQFAQPRKAEFAITYSEVLGSWSITFYNLGNINAAKSKILEAKELLEQNNKKQTIAYAKTLMQIANVCLSQSDFRQMEANLIAAKTVMEELKETEHPTYARILSGLGAFYQYEANYTLSETILQQALTLIEKVEGKADLSYAIALSNLAQVYKMQNKMEKSEAAYLQMQQIVLEKAGRVTPFFTNALSGLADLYARTKRYKEAEALYVEVIQIQKEFGAEPSIFMNSNWALATTRAMKGDLADAEALYTLILPFFDTYYQKELALRALLLKDVANLYTEKKDYARAEQFVMKAFDANSARIDSTAQITEAFIQDLGSTTNYCNETHLRLLESLNRLLSAHYQQSKDPQWLKKAQTLHQSIFQFLQRMRDQAIWVEDKLAMLEKNAQIVECGINTTLELKGNTDNEGLAMIFGIMEQNKMLLLSDIVQSRKAQHFGNLPAEVIAEEERLQKESDLLRKELRAASEKSAKDSLQAALNDFGLRQKQFQLKLEKDYPKYFQHKYASLITTPQELRKILPEKSAIIEYFVSDSTVYCLAFTATTYEFFTFDISSKDLQAKVKDLRRTLSDYHFIQNSQKEAQQLYSQTAYWFYQNLLEPALKMSPDVEHLVVVPDGLLSNLPFETFLSEPTSADVPYSNMPYLIKKYRISYSYSASLLVENSKQQRANNGKVLAMAASYPKTETPMLADASRSLRSSELRNLRAILSDLPSAKKEVEAIEKYFSGEFLYAEQANETQFKQLAPQYGVLHLAMHGLMDANEPTLSSLAFTENSDPKEDNFLQAYEISQLKLQSDLVVLSACETGAGRFQQGEGLLSLARAFMYAGVPSMVVSLWEVNDASTAKIMEFFYKELAAGKDKAEALRQAKLLYLSETQGLAAHPAYWSAFVQLGDSQPVNLQPKSNAMMFWLLFGGGGFVLVLLAARLMKKNKGR